MSASRLGRLRRGRATYTVAGSGENMWATRDAFQFAWKKASRRPRAGGRHRVPRPGQGAASQGVPDDPPGPRRRLGLRRRRAARRRPDLAAVPRGQGRRHARGPGERLGAEAAPHREEGQVRAACTWPPRRRTCNSPARPCGSRSGSRSTSASASARTTTDVTEKAVFSNVELSTRRPRRVGAADGLQHARDAVARLDRPPRGVTSRRRGSRRPTGCATAQTLIYNSGGRIHRIPADRRRRPSRSTPASPRGATTTTGVSPDGNAAGDQRPVAGAAPVAHLHAAGRPAGRPSSSRRPARRTGTAGRPTARPWPSAASAAASSTSTPSPPRAAPRRG